MPTPTIVWNVDADGDWSNTADWSPARLPGASDDVAIDTTDLHTVTHSIGVDSVHSLTVGADDFVVSGGFLGIASSASFANLLTVSGGTLAFGTASATIARFDQSGGKISGMGILTVTGAATFTSKVKQTGAGTTLVQGGMTLAAGAILTLDGDHTLSLSGANSTLAGRVTGSGTLDFAGGTQSLNSGASLGVANWSISGGAKTSLRENLTYAKTFVDGSGTRLNIRAGRTLTLTGTSTLAGSIHGKRGTLALSGGTADFNEDLSGKRTHWTANVSLSHGAAVTVNGRVDIRGGVSQARGTTISVNAGGTLTLDNRVTADSTFAGSVTGAGSLNCTGQTLVLNPGARLATASWFLANSVVTLNENLTYASAFTDFANSDVNPNGFTLTLSGTASFTAVSRVDGSGTIALEGATSINGLGIFGSVTMINTGVVSEIGQLTVGDTGPATAFFINGVGGQYDITDDAGIDRGAPASTFTNAGTLAKTGGSGVSRIDLKVTNTGTISVAGGTLKFTSAVSGAGAATIDGGTLDFEAAFTGNVSFSPAIGGLVLARSQAYIGTVSGFSTTGASSLDLRDIGFVGAGEASFSGTAADGTLTVTDGTHTAHIKLAGNYLSSTFTASSDGHGGTIVVDSKSPSAALTHRFIAAAAGLAGSAGEAIHPGAARADPGPMLAKPHAMIA